MLQQVPGGMHGLSPTWRNGSPMQCDSKILYMGYGIPVWSGCIVKSMIIPTGAPVTWILLGDHV